MLPVKHLAVLKKIAAILDGTSVKWVLTGSCGMVLQGMPLEVHDIDLQPDRKGAYEIGRLLAEFMVSPVTYKPSERIRSHFGEFLIDGVEVQVMGDMTKLRDDGTWEEPVCLEKVRVWVEIDGIKLPVLPLEYEYEAYKRMGRLERAQSIRAWLDGNMP